MESIFEATLCLVTLFCSGDQRPKSVAVPDACKYGYQIIRCCCFAAISNHVTTLHSIETVLKKKKTLPKHSYELLRDGVVAEALNRIIVAVFQDTLTAALPNDYLLVCAARGEFLT